MRDFSHYDLKLYTVIETPLLKVPLYEFIIQTSLAGVTAFQLRDKGSDGASMVQNAMIIKKALTDLKGHKPLFIINDRADIAHVCGADGVHVGIKDVSPQLLKKSFPDLIIGSSCNNLQDAALASKWSDYAGVGPIFHTSTKKDLRSVIGIQGAKDISKALSVPCVAIGGINEENCSDVIKSGVSGLALSSCICSSQNPYDTVKAIIKAAYG